MSYRRFCVTGVVVVGGCIVSVLAWADGPPAPAPPMASPEFKFQRAHPVVRVEDARTVVVRVAGKDTTVPLAGVRRINSLAARKSERLLAEAHNFLDNLLKGERVYLVHEGPAASSDEDRPRPAYLYRAPDGLFVNLELVRQGYAVTVVGTPFKHREVFLHYDRRAAGIGKGLRPAMRGPGAAGLGATTHAAGLPEPVVYVTQKGRRYHREGCRFVRSGAKAIPRRGALESGLEACKVCKPGK